MVINEIFYSLQGEGFLAGLPSMFVRLAGCPLRCRWCDTKYAWDQAAGAHYSVAKIVQTVQQAQSKFVVITGGEPMTDSDLPQLVQELKAAGKHITIETAGIAFVPDMPCDLMSVSPKLSNSTPSAEDRSQKTEIRSLAPTPVVGARGTEVKRQKFLRSDMTILRKLIDNYKYQLKFVVDSQDDLLEIQQTIKQIGNVDLEKVMLMPQAATRDELLAKSPMVADLCKRSGFTFSPRLQVLLWDNIRGR
ncbi:7-carboxy-7-deazaguanine synthase [subsurface metagenome]